MSNPTLPPFELGEKRTLAWNGAEPFWKGTNKFGKESAGWEVVWNGSLYAFFPSSTLLPEIFTLLPKTRTITVERAVKQGARGPINDWRCFAADSPPASAMDKRDQATRDFETSLSMDDTRNAEDRKRKDIASAVALKAALEFNAGRPSTPEAVISNAEIFKAWLLS